MLKDYSEIDIINGLQQQDSLVLDFIYNEIGPKVKAYIVKVGGNSDEADDIFQEGIVAAFLNIRSGKYSHNSGTKFSTYLIQICKYKWFDLLKSAHKKKSGGELIDNAHIDDYDIEESIINSEKYVALHQLIDDLGEKCKEILNRFYWLKESVVEIAHALKMEPASIKNGKYRCMQKLKENALDNDSLEL